MSNNRNLILELYRDNAIILKVKGTDQVIGTIKLTDRTTKAYLSLGFPETIEIERTDCKVRKPKNDKEVT